MKLLEGDIGEIVSPMQELARTFSGKRVLLTGGCGFLGRYFVGVFAYLNEHVLDSSCEVTVLDNFITASRGSWETDSALKSFRFVEHDVTKPFAAVDSTDYVISLAGIASPYYYRKHPLETVDVSIKGTRNMLDLAKEHGARLMLVSTSEIYGDPDAADIPTAESYYGNVSCHGARAVYDEPKRVAETLTRLYHDEFGVDTTIVRPFNVFGPGMNEHDYRVMPSFASEALKGEPLRVYGTGQQTRTFCYVSDAIRGFLQVLLAGRSGEAYNIGTPGPEVTMVKLAETFRTVVGPELQIEVVEYPESYPSTEPQRRCPDIAKAGADVGYGPGVGLEEGIRRFMDWAQGQYAQPAAAGTNGNAQAQGNLIGPQLRELIIERSYEAGVGHIGSALSVADIVAALYGHVLAIDDLKNPDRDLFVLSKGHAAMALYAALHLKGWLSAQELATYCQDDSRLGTHPETMLPGVEFSTGSLGQGVLWAAGSALAAEMSGSSRRVFALVSDGECNEGSLWEAAMFAAHHRLGNLTVIVDVNGQQCLGKTAEVLDLDSLYEKWSAFGWGVTEVDGHDELALAAVLQGSGMRSRPHVVLANTTAGKGVSFMEGEVKWHYLSLSDEQYNQAKGELSGSVA